MGTGWPTCIPAVLLPHSPCRSTTANAPANRRVRITSVVSTNYKKQKNNNNSEIWKESIKYSLVLHTKT